MVYMSYVRIRYLKVIETWDASLVSKGKNKGYM